jgi:hypothetical protein
MGGLIQEHPSIRRRYQFSLRTLLLIMLLSCVAMSVVAARMQQASKQRRAVDTFKSVGCMVRYDFEGLGPGPIGHATGPAWLRDALGQDFFNRVISVDAKDFAPVTDALLENLRPLSGLKRLSLKQTEISDTGLANIERLVEIECLDLSDTNVTDSGLRHLAPLRRLQGLYLVNTRVTDAGLEQLKGLRRLKWLELSGTGVTDAGLKELTSFEDLESLGLIGTRITDAGLEHLKGLRRLKSLNLVDTMVTDVGLEYLQELPQLENLWIENTKVTDHGVKTLRHALPKCDIQSSGASTGARAVWRGAEERGDGSGIDKIGSL